MEIKKSVIIIGGGWSGIGVAGSLAYNKFGDYLLLEQTDCLGGFWKYHTYDSVRMHDLTRYIKHLLNLWKSIKIIFFCDPKYPHTYSNMPNFMEYRIIRYLDLKSHEFLIKKMKNLVGQLLELTSVIVLKELTSVNTSVLPLRIVEYQ